MAAKIGVRSGSGALLTTLGLALLAAVWVGSVLETQPKLPFFAVGGVLVLLLLARSPRLMLSALVPVLALNVGVTGTLTLKLGLAGAVGAVWVAGLLTNRWRLNLLGHGLLAALGLLLAASLYTSGGPDFPVRQSDFHGFLAALVLCAAAMSIGLIPRVLLRSTAYGIGLIALLYELGALGETSAAFWEERGSALELNPNYLGVLFASGVIASAALLCGHVRGRERLLALLSVGLCVVGMFTTQSRGALLVVAVGLAVILVAVVRSRAIVGLTILGFAVLVAVTPTARTDVRDAALGNRDAADFTVSDTLRGDAASLALRYATSHPFDGIGYGLFPTRSSEDGEEHVELNTHNDFLRLSAEVGAPALAALLILLVPALRRGNLRTIDNGLRALLLAQVVSLLTGNYLSNLQVSGPLWLILGYVWWRSRLPDAVENSAETSVRPSQPV
jgi:O-Antigen ligase